MDNKVSNAPLNASKILSFLPRQDFIILNYSLPVQKVSRANLSHSSLRLDKYTFQSFQF